MPCRTSRSPCVGVATAAELIDRVIYDNPADFLGQSPKFQIGATREAVARAADGPRSESDASVGSGAAAA